MRDLDIFMLFIFQVGKVEHIYRHLLTILGLEFGVFFTNSVCHTWNIQWNKLKLYIQINPHQFKVINITLEVKFTLRGRV